MLWAPIVCNELTSLLCILTGDKDFPGGLEGKASVYNEGDLGQIPGSGRSPGEGDGTPVFLPGESHGQRNLVGYNPQGRKESDMTERLTLLLSYSQLIHIVVQQKLI